MSELQFKHPFALQIAFASDIYLIKHSNQINELWVSNYKIIGMPIVIIQSIKNNNPFLLLSWRVKVQPWELRHLIFTANKNNSNGNHKSLHSYFTETHNI